MTTGSVKTGSLDKYAENHDAIVEHGNQHYHKRERERSPPCTVVMCVRGRFRPPGILQQNHKSL